MFKEITIKTICRKVQNNIDLDEKELNNITSGELCNTRVKIGNDYLSLLDIAIRIANLNNVKVLSKNYVPTGGNNTNACLISDIKEAYRRRCDENDIKAIKSFLFEKGAITEKQCDHKYTFTPTLQNF